MFVRGFVCPGGEVHDQKRTATPGEAIRAGADYLVVGRPILEAKNPCAAVDAILAEMTAALPVVGRSVLKPANPRAAVRPILAEMY